MAFKRVLERWLFKVRGHQPVVVEQLVCGHALFKTCAAHWVKDRKFPTANAYERLCKLCDENQPPLSWRPEETGEVVLHEKFDLLTALAKAAAEPDKTKATG